MRLAWVRAVYVCKSGATYQIMEFLPVASLKKKKSDSLSSIK